MLYKGVAIRPQLALTGHFLRHLYCQWDTLNVPRMAASLTYYTTAALAPLVVVLLAVVGFTFGSATARESVIAAVQLQVGDTAANVVQALITSISHPKVGILASVLGAIALFFGATGVFIELNSSLRTIWNVSEPSTRGVWGLLLDRVVSFLMVVVTGAMIVLSIFISTSLAAFHRYFTDWAPDKGGQLPDIVFSLAFATALADP